MGLVATRTGPQQQKPEAGALRRPPQRPELWASIQDRQHSRQTFAHLYIRQEGLGDPCVLRAECGIR